DNPEDADIIVINTCSVREHAEQRALGRISDLQKFRREKPELVLVVIGCMAERLGDKIPGADFFIGPRKYDRLPEIIKKIVSSKQVGATSRLRKPERSMRVGAPPLARRKPSPPYPNPDGGVSAFLPVMRGCNNFCSYCIVPYVRGNAVSRNSDDILGELRYLKERGVKEITLLGQSVNQYNFGEISFPELLRMVDRKAPGMRIRFLTSHPAYMSDGLIDAMAECDSVCENIHLPVQSGSDRILKMMERKYTVDEYRHWVRLLKDRIKDVAVTTDVMVGFPTETEKDFKETLEIIKEVRFDFAYMFMYSEREGTKAALFPDDVLVDVKKERLERLIKLQNSITREKNEELVGKVVEILIEGKSRRDNLPMGKTRTGKEVIVKNAKCKMQNAKVGEYVNVYVESISGWTGIGRVVKGKVI
ncbi:MAG: tRNA (N6-isopentenyl adenosine(37)-C2)-methylthiotransferase MiaB, partial [bacterium]|nr:tRNA (N6-isopentenyl adenosine(37)-C2)-methylthiotransferase MiaB [bacterium]